MSRRGFACSIALTVRISAHTARSCNGPEDGEFVPTYYYDYNPYSQVYWGRSPIESDKPQYSKLAEKDRKKELKDIAADAFPEPTDPTAIPESSDNVTMELPPKDTPTIPKTDK